MQYRIVFWTSNISPHNIHIFECLGRTNDVIVAYVEKSFRGLSEYTPCNVKLKQITNKSDVEVLIENTKGYIHINNALRVAPKFKILQVALKYLIKSNCKIISLFQEKFPDMGIMGYMRRLKWTYVYRIGLGRKHMAIGYCGDQSLQSLHHVGVKNIRLFEFNYSTEFEEVMYPELPKFPSFIFVGQLVKRKAVLETIVAFKKIKEDFVFTIIGDGELNNEVRSLIKGDARFRYLGLLPKNLIQREYNKADCVVLPSYFDGWGCVVNEGISQGCRVLVSDGCGAASLLYKAPFLGNVFKSGNWSELQTLVVNEIRSCDKLRKNRENIKKYWFKISPQAMSDYLVKCLHSILTNQEFPTPCWKI